MKTRKNLTGYPSVDKTHQKEWSFFESHPLIPNLSIWDVFCLMTRKYNNEIAVECMNLKVSYAELKQDVRKLSQGLLTLGVKVNDIIVAIMPNMYHSVLLFFAANKVGATVTFLNCLSENEEIRKYLLLFDSPLLFSYDWSEERSKTVVNGTNVRHVITIKNKESQIRPDFCAPVERNMNKMFLAFGDLFRVNFRQKKNHILAKGNINALILYTSGTTGMPKPVVLSNRNIIAEAIYMKNSSHIVDVKGEKSLVCVPFTYPYGFVTSALLSLLCGRTAILMPELTSKTIVYCMAKKPNLVFGSPAFLELMKRNIPENIDLSSIHTFITGGDFMTVSQEKEGIEYFAKHNAVTAICNGSGNAETCGGNTNIVGVRPKAGTVGKPLTGMQSIIIDEDNNEMHYGEEGQLCLSGENVFKCYYGDEDKTRDAKIKYKGRIYFKTGSVGYLDEEGYFTLTNRLTRFYITLTLNKVYCDYVQNIMSEIEMVDTVAVVKKPDKEKLYVGMAFIVLKEGVEQSEQAKQQIFNQCESEIKIHTLGTTVRLKKNEIPEYICFMDALPKTVAGKIDYFVLEDIARQKK